MIRWRSAGGAMAAALAFEVLLRHLAWGHGEVDPRLGWMWKSETVVHRLGEGWGVSHWGPDGARIPPPQQPAAPRVLIVGDSFTEAQQVNDDEVYSGRLRSVAAVNVGHASLSSADYVAFASEYRARFQPAWVVIELNPEDLSDDAFDPAKTHFDARLAVTVVPLHFGRVSRILMWFRQRSALLDNSISRWQAYRTTSRMPRLFLAADADRPTAPIGSSPQPQAWPVQEELDRLEAAFGGRVTFLLIPKFREPSTVERDFLAACTREGLSCADLRSTFAGFRIRGAAPFGFPNSRFAEGHLNAEGHAAVAVILENELTRLRRRGLF